MRVLAVDLLPPCNCPKVPQRSQACATCRELQVARHGLPQHACTVYKSCVAVCACTIAWTLRAYLHSLSKGTQSHLDQHRQIPGLEHNTTHRTYMHHMRSCRLSSHCRAACLLLSTRQHATPTQSLFAADFVVLQLEAIGMSCHDMSGSARQIARMHCALLRGALPAATTSIL